MRSNPAYKMTKFLKLDFNPNLRLVNIFSKPVRLVLSLFSKIVRFIFEYINDIIRAFLHIGRKIFNPKGSSTFAKFEGDNAA